MTKILVEYDVDVEGDCDPEEKMLEYLGRAGSPVTEDFAILINSITIITPEEQGKEK